jgi:predicted peptidase
MKKLIISLFLLLSLSTFSQNIAKSIVGSTGEKFAFLQYVPSGTTPKPLIIFLHGIGERGASDTFSVRSVENNEIPKLIRDKVFTQDFIVLSPQLNSTKGWWPSWIVADLIKYAKANLNVDASRIYLTGLSLGGGGVWTCLEDSVVASQLAAAAPVCGTCNYINGQWIVKNNIPVWMFHAQNDATVGVGCSGGAYADLKKKGATVKATFYQDGGHSIWGRAYDQGNPTWPVKNPDLWPGLENQTANPNIYQWFLTNKKAGVVTPPVVVPPAPTKTIIARLFVNGMEIIVYSDKTTEVK